MVYADNMNKFLHNRLHENAKGVIYGKCWQGAKVIRTGKWHISKLLYAASSYPDYCAGAFFLMTNDIPKCILAQLDKTSPYFFIEDM